MSGLAAERASAARVVIALLVGLATGCRGPEERPPAGGFASPAPGIESYFEEATEAAGLGRRGLSFGMAVGDVDGDGREDVVLSNHGIPSLHLNRGGRFERAPEGYFPRLARADRHLPLLADLDDDGRLDLVLTRGADDGRGQKENEVLRQTADGFREVTGTGLEDPPGRSRGAALLDVDGDGRLDLLFANARRRGAPNRLLVNRGSLRFAPADLGLDLSLPATGTVVAADFDGDHDLDVVLSQQATAPLLFFERAGERFRGWQLGEFGDVYGIAAGDYDNDGDLDLYLAAGDVGDPPRDLLRQQAPDRLAFTVGIGKLPDDRRDEVSFSAGALSVRLSHPTDLSLVRIGRTGRSPRSKAFRLTPEEAAGEPPGEGALLWYDGGWRMRLAGEGVLSFKGVIRAPGKTTSWEVAARGLEDTAPEPEYANHLLRNDGRRRFVDVTGETGAGDARSSRGAAWLDADADGDLDLFLVNSGHNLLGDQPDVLFVNQLVPSGRPRFTGVELPALETGRGDSLLLFDADHDGAVDLLLTNGYGSRPNTPGPVRFLRGRPRGNWVEVRLVGSGPGGINRQAVGAELRLTTADGKAQYRQVTAGNSVFRSSPSPTQHFGLGDSDRAGLEVRWPNGRRSRHNLRPGCLHLIHHP